MKSRKPIISIRTGNHGFHAPLPYKISGKQVRWAEDVLGGTFLEHHGNWHADSTRGTIVAEQNSNHRCLVCGEEFVKIAPEIFRVRIADHSGSGGRRQRGVLRRTYVAEKWNSW